MPEGNDFVGGLGVLFVVDAVTELWGSFECLPAGPVERNDVLSRTRLAPDMHSAMEIPGCSR